MTELRDVIASVLAENRLKPPRVQANLVLELVDGRKPVASKPAGCAVCASWESAVNDKSIREQAIAAAVSLGREVPMIRFLLGELDRTARKAT